NMRLDTVAERQEWSEGILAQIRKWLETETSGEMFLLDGDPRMIPSARKQPKILVLAGSDYVDGWAPEARKLGVIVDDPLHGMTLGARRSLAKALVDQVPKRPTREEFLT